MQRVLSADGNCAQPLASSSRALSSSAVQVAGRADHHIRCRAAAGRGDIEARHPAGRACEAEGGGVEAEPTVPVTSEILAHAATSGVLCAPRVRQDACCSVGKIAAARLAPQYAVSTISSALQATVQPSALQSARTTRIDEAGLGGPAGPCGPCCPCGPCGP